LRRLSASLPAASFFSIRASRRPHSRRPSPDLKAADLTPIPTRPSAARRLIHIAARRWRYVFLFMVSDLSRSQGLMRIKFFSQCLFPYFLR
jgi:hypothetical protein